MAKNNKPYEISELRRDGVLTVSLSHLSKTEKHIHMGLFIVSREDYFFVMLMHEIALRSIFIMSISLCLTTTFILHIFSVRDLNGLA